MHFVFEFSADGAVAVIYRSSKEEVRLRLVQAPLGARAELRFVDADGELRQDISELLAVSLRSFDSSMIVVKRK